MAEDEKLDDERSALATITSLRVSTSPVKSETINTNTDTNTDSNLTVFPTTPPLRKKALSYSQPLAHDAPSRRKNPMRKHSLDEDEYRHGMANPSADDSNPHRFYQHSSSLPEDTLRHPNHHLPLPPRSTLSLDRTAAPADEPDPVDGPARVAPEPLPEFMASGGGTGIFKVPSRAAVHPDRPPALELRPHPLRETQAGSFLRTIACAPGQLWAGQESGVRFWNLANAFSGREEIAGSMPRGDEESSPFYESCWTSPTLCLVVDAGNRLVWSGHKDGKIRSWKTNQLPQQVSVESSSADTGNAASSAGVNSGAANATASVVAATQFKEGLSWQAHRAPVLSMVFTANGDLWSGSEGGIIKIWPWETIEKSLSLKMEEKHLAALLVERAATDLRSQVTINGACPLPLADIKFLVSDNCRSKVWSGTSLSFALWNSRTKELLRVFNIDGQVENKGDISSGHDSCDEETKVKPTSTSKKEKSKESVSFFQRSRNALMGAADAVRRVASKSAFGEDNKKTEAMIISMDGMIWTGLNNGMLVQWDGNASRLQEVQHHSSSVQCLCAFGTRIWVGYMSGHIQILDLEGNLLGGWVAHSSPVIKLAVGGDYIFTLANHGGIRGWSLTSPGPTDDILRSELTLKESLFSKREHVKIMVGSWNVGQGRAAHDSLVSWVGCASSEADVVVVGLQEVDMGAGFLAMAAAKETVGLEGSANGHWWMDNIGKTLGEGTIFERVGSRQLAALLISAWARKSIKKHIGDIDAGAVACGFGRAIGNKGSVSLRMRVYDRIVCFANCHLAAHLEAVNKRNADFDHIYRNMSYSRTLTANVSATAGSSSAVQVLRGSNATVVPSDEGNPELAEADMVVFFGDFNYRLYGITYDEARDIVSQRCFDWLREKDQLRAEMKAGKVFQGMREGLIRFPPTYKFEKYKPGLAGYDSGEKKRIPAWCDRILYRDNRSLSVEECSLECPVVTSILQYEACMDVNDSDHKPIRCIYSVSIARIDELIRRQQFGEILFSNGRIKALLEELYTIPEALISTNDIILQSQNTSLLHVTNTSEKETALFEICCDSQASSKEGSVLERNPRGAFGLPRWLEVTPVYGIIKPEGTAEVSVRHEEMRSLEDLADSMAPDRNEESKDKQVTLVVNIMRGFSTRATSHRVTVHLRLPSKLAANGTELGSSKRAQSIHKPELQHLDSNAEAVDDSKNLQGSFIWK